MMHWTKNAYGDSVIPPEIREAKVVCYRFVQNLNTVLVSVIRKLPVVKRRKTKTKNQETNRSHRNYLGPL
eukprot:15365119-Ditylum_brightwellii.AAC.1